MKILLSFFILFFLLASPCHSLNTSKAPVHYAVEMEHFYLKPRVEIIPRLLQSFSKGGYLSRPEQQLVVAAFLAELVKKRSLSIDDLAKIQVQDMENFSRTLAWTAHLSKQPIPATLGQNCSRLLLTQIKNTQPDLAGWDIYGEPTVVFMFWGAYMATGNIIYLDKIIDCALSLTGSRPLPSAKTAAASLYDMAPQHPAVLERIRLRHPQSSAEAKKLLEMIIKQNTQSKN